MTDHTQPHGVSGQRFDLGEIFDALAGWDEVEALLGRRSGPELPEGPRERLQFQVEHQGLLVRAMRHPDEHLRRRAVLIGCDLVAVVRLALRDGCATVRATGASSRVAPLHLLMELVDDPEHEPRGALGRNPNTPLSALVRLLHDPSREVRHLAAHHPSLPPSLLAALALHPDWRMAAGAVDNPSVTPEVLDLVATRAAKNLAVTAWLNKRVTERRASCVSST
jgi:hypothetical protein